MNVAIKLPNDLNGKLLTFPFLHQLYKKLEANIDEEDKLTIHLLSNGDGIDVLNLLPFHAFYHEFEEGDLKSIFTAHRACMNFKINELDLYISTTESFVDASLGRNFSAKTKVGYSLGKNNFFLNKKVSFLTGRHKSEQALELLKTLDVVSQDVPNVYGRNIDPAYTDWETNSYAVLDLPLKEGEIDEEWIEFISLFEEHKFVFFCSKLETFEAYGKVSDFIKKLSPKNEYKNFQYESQIELAKITSFAKTVVTENISVLNLSSYCGQYSFFINSNTPIHVEGPLYFLGETREFRLSDPSFKDGNGIHYGRVFDEIYAYVEEK